MANSLLKNIPAVASRKFAIKLIAALPHEVRGNEIFCGNHSVRNLPDGVTSVYNDGGVHKVDVVGNRAFTYHGTIIAVVDDYRRLIYVTSAGYGQMSTSAAIRQYLAHFCGLGYKAAIVE